MPFCQRTHGVLNLKIDNVSYDIEGEAMIQPSEYTYRPKPNGHVTVEYTSPSIRVTLQIPDEINVTDILTKCGGTISLQEHNGRVWVLEQVKPTYDGEPWNVNEGNVTITFVGVKMRENNPNRRVA